MDEQKFPSDLQAECSVLGTMMGTPDGTDDVLAMLKAEDFYDPVHAKIFAAIAAVHRSGKRADIVTVRDQMETAGTLTFLSNREGPAYLTVLTAEHYAPEGVVQHAALVREKAILREVIGVGSRLRERAMQGDRTADEMLADSQRDLFALNDRLLTSKALHLKPILHSACKVIGARYETRRYVTGIPSGIDDLDELTSGWQSGKLIVVGGRPGMGKTALAIGVALAAAAKGFPVLFDSLEMPKEEIGERILATDGQIDGSILRTGLLREREWIQLTKSASRLADLPMWIDESPTQTLLTISAKARRWKRNKAIFPNGNELGLLIVDYLQLIDASEKRFRPNRNEEVAEISKGLKALSKELGIPVIALASLNRDCEKRADKRPTMIDVKESGNIESDADLLITLYRDEVYNAKSEEADMAEIILCKHRGGATGTVKARYIKAQTRFENLPAPKRDAWSPN